MSNLDYSKLSDVEIIFVKQAVRILLLCKSRDAEAHSLNAMKEMYSNPASGVDIDKLEPYIIDLRDHRWRKLPNGMQVLSND